MDRPHAVSMRIWQAHPFRHSLMALECQAGRRFAEQHRHLGVGGGPVVFQCQHVMSAAIENGSGDLRLSAIASMVTIAPVRSSFFNNNGMAVISLDFS